MTGHEASRRHTTVAECLNIAVLIRNTSHMAIIKLTNHTLISTGAR